MIRRKSLAALLISVFAGSLCAQIVPGAIPEVLAAPATGEGAHKQPAAKQHDAASKKPVAPSATPVPAALKSPSSTDPGDASQLNRAPAPR